MQYKALRTFNSPYGLVRSGAVLTLNETYARQLIRYGLIEVYAPRNVAHAEAPSEGKRRAIRAVTPPADGEAAQSSVRRRGRRSPPTI